MKPNHVYRIDQFLSNYDGDSFHFLLDCGFGIKFKPDGGYRLDGADTPEMKGGTKISKWAAREAKEFAKQFINYGIERKDANLHSIDAGKFGRPLSKIYVAGLELGEELIKQNLAAPYHGQSKSLISAIHEDNYTILLKRKDDGEAIWTLPF